jgi:uncharacterized protein YqjF (DUF2071 family)
VDHGTGVERLAVCALARSARDCQGARWLLPLPGHSSFAELNVRTYVTFGGKPGVFFFSLDATSHAAVWAARATYHLPYFFAEMEVKRSDGWIG